jgi:IrrE N-terminal-like domain
MALPKQKIAVRPESESRISDLVRKLIRQADAEGILPTPLDRLSEIAKVINIGELPDETFLQTLSAEAKGFFRSAMQKLRGIADLRHRTNYVPRDPNTGRELFVKAHELGHQVMPWHAIDPAYLDDNESLSPSAKATFEQEANFFGSETIFQGARFRTAARDYQPSFDAIFTLADQHGASKQSTAWRFVEEQDEALALVQYYPTSAIDQEGNRVLNVWLSVGSPAFNKRYAAIDVPVTIRTGHPWVAARDINRACDGNEVLDVGGHKVTFEWRAWWNGYVLLVLLRRKPMLSVVGGWLKP